LWALAPALAVAVAMPAPAGAASWTSYMVDVSAHGSIVVSWRGDPARGCAAAGMCDERGSFTLRPNLDGQMELIRDGGRWESFGSTSLSGGDESVVVRARHDEPGRDPTLCIEPLHAPLTVAVAPAARGLSRVGVGTSFDGPISAGRCAGPTEGDVVQALPTGPIDVGRAHWTPVALRLAGHRTFDAGPLAGEVAYDVALRVAHLRLRHPLRDGGGGSEPPATVEIAYRVERLTAQTTADFAGLPELGCDLLDACGTTGIATRRVDFAGGDASLTADPAHGRAPGSRAAILRAFRAGRMPVFGGVSPPDGVRGTATVEELRAGGAGGCRDTAPGPAIGIDLLPGRAAVQLQPSASVGRPDPLRARCPGPTRGDVLGERASAAGNIAPGDLLRPHVTLRLAGAGRFAGKGYGGRHATTIVAELRRTRLVIRPGR
jgi:hypothetical protein